MTRNNFVTALGFGVFAFLSSTLYTTPAQAFHLLGHSYSHVGVGSPVWKVGQQEDCPPGATFSVERGKCVCPPGMRFYNLAEVWGGKGDGCFRPQRPVKSIGKKKPSTSGGVGGGSTDCGPGYSYNPETGCRKIKGIGKKKVMPEAEQAPEQTQTDANTSGGGGDAEAASGPGHSPNGGGGGGDGD